MGAIVMLTAVESEARKTVLPALELLPHQVQYAPLNLATAGAMPPADVIIVDASTDLGSARQLCRILGGTTDAVAVVVLIAANALSLVNANWLVDDIIMADIEPAELQTRLRLASERQHTHRSDGAAARAGVVIDEAAYTASAHGRDLNLTYKEFELLRYLAAHPGRVLTRAQILNEVWGYDFFGGTRTVDVHVRRLRAKLSPDAEGIIDTVRNVGYRFVA